MAAVSHAAPRGSRLARVSAAVAVAGGKVAGRVLSVLPSVPGLGGAVLVSVGAGETASHVFGHGLAPWVGLVVGGVFGLMLDRRI